MRYSGKKGPSGTINGAKFGCRDSFFLGGGAFLVLL